MATENIYDKAKFPVQVIYDVGASIHAPADTENSVTTNGPFVVEVGAIAAGTVGAIEAKIHIDAPWVQVGVDLDSTNTPKLEGFGGIRYNYVRVRRKSGADNFKAYSQT